MAHALLLLVVVFVRLDGDATVMAESCPYQPSFCTEETEGAFLAPPDYSTSLSSSRASCYLFSHPETLLLQPSPTHQLLIISLLSTVCSHVLHHVLTILLGIVPDSPVANTASSPPAPLGPQLKSTIIDISSCHRSSTVFHLPHYDRSY